MVVTNQYTRAFITKWWWKIMNNPKYLVCKILEDKYGIMVGRWRKKHKNNYKNSYFWKSVMSMKNAFWAGITFKIEKGEYTSFSEDKWGEFTTQRIVPFTLCHSMSTW